MSALPDKKALTANLRDPIQPTLQRFISRDPIGLRGGKNLYSYVRNSPTNLIDPKGTSLQAAGALLLEGGGAAAFAEGVVVAAAVYGVGYLGSRGIQAAMESGIDYSDPDYYNSIAYLRDLDRRHQEMLDAEANDSGLVKSSWWNKAKAAAKGLGGWIKGEYNATKDAWRNSKCFGGYRKCMNDCEAYLRARGQTEGIYIRCLHVCFDEEQNCRQLNCGTFNQPDWDIVFGGEIGPSPTP